ncbi:hypothetical protein F4814DRAFT_399941 [Daldinia grandis]|nr:hypothetical protein F4814DRAFT_399941 [Daldinia grandis]
MMPSVFLFLFSYQHLLPTIDFPREEWEYSEPTKRICQLPASLSYDFSKTVSSNNICRRIAQWCYNAYLALALIF